MKRSRHTRAGRPLGDGSVPGRRAGAARRRDVRHPYYVQISASGHGRSVTEIRQQVRRFLHAIGSKWTERVLIKRIHEVRAETVYDPRWRR